MSKKIKRIISCTLVLGAVCFLGQVNNKLIKEADAYTVSVSTGEIKTMTIKDDNGDELPFINNFEEAEEIDYDGNEKNFYVILPKDSEEVTISFSIKNEKDKEDYVGRIFTSSDDDAKPYTSGDSFTIDEDYTTFYIRTYRSDDKFRDAYNDDEVSRCAETYKVTVKREGAKENSAEEGSSSYNGIKVKDEIELPHIKTDTAAEAKTYKNQWVQKGNYWLRYNENGDALRNAWYLDTNGKYYYLQANGYMTTGWRYIDGKWYYFDKSGAMQTGWLKNTEGKWYYFDESGAMARNTTINGYRLNALGQYVK